MKPALRFHSRLQYKLIGVVVIAFLSTLLVSTATLVASIDRLGRMAIADRVNEELLIANQRFAEFEANLVQAAVYIARQPGLIDALNRDDGASLARIALDTASHFDYDAIIVADRLGRTFSQTELGTILLTNFRNQSIGDAPQNAVFARLVATEQGIFMVALSPVRDEGRERLGTATVAAGLDRTWLGILNFNRANMALVVFADPDLPGISADEAHGNPHLNVSEVEALRADEALFARIQAGEIVHFSNVNVRGTPHAVVYHPFHVGGEQTGYYVIAVDEQQPLTVQNNILLVSLVTIIVALTLIACLIAITNSHLVLRPLQRLGDAARKLAEGELAARVAIFSADEVGQLGVAFNEMAMRIETRTRQLDDLNQTLEARITARTAQVRQQSAWLETILGAAQEAIVVTDQNQAVRLINAAALDIIGITEAEVLGIPLYELMRYARGEPVEWPGDLDGGRQGEIEFKGRYFLFSVSPLSTGQPTGYVCVLTDITPLRRLDALKSQVIRMASHDLRTPITSLRLQSQLLKRVADPIPEQQMRLLERLDRTISDLQRMVNDLLDLERIERQASGFRESVSLNALLDSAVSVLSGEIENKQHTLRMEIAGELPSVCGDPAQLLEVIRNLLTNAVKYTPSGGSIHLCAYTLGEHVCIQVKDNGIGIDAEDIPHLFTPHFRAQTALATAEEGNGIGLSLVKTVVERHGGKVWVESQRGSGSTFTFSLPIDQTCIQREEL